MTADKRTPHTDALDTLGKVHQYDEKRDAIHLGVEPVVAAHTLKPGQHIGFDKNGKASKSAKELLGIVDPFLKAPVNKGEKFWLVVYPREITSLRHVWEHPKFPNSREIGAEEIVLQVKTPTAKEEAYAWIQDYAESFGRYSDYDYGYQSIDADDLIYYAKSNIERREGDWKDYLVKGGLLEGEYVSEEFWNKLAIYLDVDIPENRRENFFSCSC